MSKRKDRRKKRRRMRRNFFRAFIVSVIIFSIGYLGIMFMDNSSNQISEDHSESINFLLLGVDSKDVTENGNTRSDTIMLFNLNKDTGDINILSIPRDTRVTIEGRMYQEKINHAYAYGGPELVVNTASNLLGIDLEYYVVADYNFVKQFVDLIGGVEMDVPVDMSYQDRTINIDLAAGNQVLDGDKSLQYLRFRGYPTADIGRVGAQQKFMKSMISQAISPKNIIKVPQMISAYNNNIQTNIPSSIMAKYGLRVAKYDLDNINTVTLPGEAAYVNGVSYYIHYEQQTQSIVQEIFNKGII